MMQLTTAIRGEKKSDIIFREFYEPWPPWQNINSVTEYLSTRVAVHTVTDLKLFQFPKTIFKIDKAAMKTVKSFACKNIVQNNKIIYF